MDSEWITTTIGDLCKELGGDIQTGPFGSQLHSHEYLPDGPVRVVTTSAVGRRRIAPEGVPRISREKADELGRHYLQEGDIVFARRGAQATGLSALVEREHSGWLGGTGIIRLRLPSSGVEPAFLSFVLSSRQSFDWIRQHAIGATMPNLNEGVIRRIPIQLPPIREQRSIAGVLGTLDNKIELNRKMNRTLEQITQTIFKSRFIDFDGHDDLVDSQLGPIPIGWEVGTLDALVELVTESVQPGKEPAAFWEHFSIPAFDAGANAAIDSGVSIKSGKYRVPENAVLVSKLNPQFPRIWLPDPDDQGRAICSTEFMPFVPKTSGRRPFAFDLLRSETIQEAIRSRVTGTTGSRQRVKPKEIATMPVVVPPASEQDRFSETVGPINERRLIARRESLVLAGLRDTLLPKLISGEIRVPAAVPAVNEQFGSRVNGNS